MTDSGDPKAHGDPEWTTWVPALTAKKKKSNVAGWVRRGGLVVVASVLVAASAVAAVRLHDGGPAHPDKWDSSLQPLVDFVEKTRGLGFEQPVYVDFVGDADFESRLTADRDARPEAAATGQAGVFQALGLAKSGPDLVGAVDRASAEATPSYYSYDDQRIVVRSGPKLTPAVMATLTASLTTALLDQSFGLGEQLAADSPETRTALLSLVDADARRTETKWRQALSDEDRAAVDKADAKQHDRVEAASKDVPPSLSALTSAHALLADAWLSFAGQKGGPQSVDDLFRSPPASQEHELDPWTLVSDHAVAIGMPSPALKDGEQEISHGTFGAVSWLVVLSERVPAVAALTAADGWGGDSYVTFTRGKSTCVRLDFRGDTSRDVREMGTALRSWVAAGPRSNTDLRRKGSLLVFESCQKGKTHAAGTGRDAGVQLAVSRTQLSARLLARDFDTRGARCGADLLVRAVPRDELAGLDLESQRVKRLTAACRQAG